MPLSAGGLRPSSSRLLGLGLELGLELGLALGLCIQARARVSGSMPEFERVVATGNEFFKGVYTEVRVRASV